MASYVFSGAVMPERATFSMNGPLDITLNHSDSGLNGQLTGAIYANQVICRLETDTPIGDMATAKVIVQDLWQILADGLCLDTTIAVQIDVRSVYDIEAGHTQVFGVSIPSIGVAHNEHGQTNIQPILNLALANPYLRRALADFRSAVMYPADTGFFCYRAVESLINYFRATTNKSKKPQAIEHLNLNLNLEARCLEYLRELSGDVRHGHPAWISGEKRHVALWITREILTRFSRILQENTQTFELLLVDMAGQPS